MHPINGAPDTLILFPSHAACRAWKQTPQHRLEVEIFDRMWLPFDATSGEARKEAAWWGYQTKPIGDNAFGTASLTVLWSPTITRRSGCLM